MLSVNWGRGPNVSRLGGEARRKKRPSKINWCDRGEYNQPLAKFVPIKVRRIYTSFLNGTEVTSDEAQKNIYPRQITILKPNNL
ncbi:hypothetical protein CEQ90_15775 [Lewinellaceae bacterium SD302]|nr:hypothetical protein CEQ90_15775 [Lewinellaceae bacterium SD302]